jgi:hypothetical protein
VLTDGVGEETAWKYFSNQASDYHCPVVWLVRKKRQGKVQLSGGTVSGRGAGKALSRLVLATLLFLFCG